MPKKRIIIIGGGFAGTQCAKVLTRKLDLSEFEVVMFNKENHMVFQPLLAEVAGSSIDPTCVTVPLRQMLPKAWCRTEDVTSIHFEQNEIEYRGFDQQKKRLSYDHLVIACGATVNLALVPGMTDHSFPLWTVGDALSLSGHVVEKLEQADVCEDPEQQKWLLSFVIAGGGFSGVEVAGEINDLVRYSARYYRNISLDEISVTLIQSRDYILPEVGPSLRQFAQAKMEEAGINFRMNARVSAVSAEGVTLDGGETIPGATVVSTIGTRPATLVEYLEAEKLRGKLLTEPDMRLKGHANVWTVGDCAVIPNAYDDSISPGTGQFALRQGEQLGRNILRSIDGEPTRPFYFRPLGQLCSIGGHNAVAEMFGWKISGFIAWFIWRTVYFMKLPTLARKTKVGFDWAWDLFFARDLALLKPNRTQRIQTAFFRPGDFIIRQGEPGTNFFIIEHGEVEVIKSQGIPSEPTTVAALGVGDFFGETALLNKGKCTASIRARTAVEVLVVGSEAFNQVAGSFTHFRQIMVRAMRQRSNLWSHNSTARSNLDNLSLEELIEPFDAEPLGLDADLSEAVEAFCRTRADLVCVTDNSGQLVGLITRTDLIQTMERLVTLPREKHTGTPLKEIMTPDPICVSTEDCALVAMSMMREHGFSKLPVIASKSDRSVKGFIRIETIIEKLFKELNRDSA